MLTFKKFFLFSIILICTTSGMTKDRALDLGEKYFNSGNYYDAINEFKRYIFFNTKNEDADLSYAYFKMGTAYRNKQEWKLALDALQKSVQTAKSDISRDERRISLAVTQISCKNYSAAKFGLIKLEMYSKYEDLRKKAYFFHGICALYEFSWDEAGTAFEEHFNIYPDEKLVSKRTKVNAVLEDALKAKYKSPSLAKCLSTFFPGTGQVYCGDWNNGLNALAINISTGYFLINDLLKRRYQDVIFNSLFLFRRFYEGNRYLAKKAAIRYNQHLNKQFAEKILKILMDK